MSAYVARDTEVHLSRRACVSVGDNLLSIAYRAHVFVIVSGTIWRIFGASVRVPVTCACVCVCVCVSVCLSVCLCLYACLYARACVRIQTSAYTSQFCRYCLCKLICVHKSEPSVEVCIAYLCRYVCFENFVSVRVRIYMICFMYAQACKIKFYYQ